MSKAVASTRAFVPALNSEGLSMLTFKGVQYKEGKMTDKKTKEPILDKEGNQREWAMYFFEFECKAKYRAMEGQKMLINTGVKYNEKELKQLLEIFGVHPDNDVVVAKDVNGFETEVAPESVSTNEFGFEDEDDGTNGEVIIEELVEPLVGKHFKARVSKGKKNGYWGVDLDTMVAL